MFGPLGRWKQPEAVTNSSATETQLTHNGAIGFSALTMAFANGMNAGC